jgi:LamB/YcsF family protein
MSNLWIDINADLGEAEESLANGADFDLMHYITSANVACGGHAGDERTMRETVQIAKQLNVAVGAHPGYPDRENFGRIESPMSEAEVEASPLWLPWPSRSVYDWCIASHTVRSTTSPIRTQKLRLPLDEQCSRATIS